MALAAAGGQLRWQQADSPLPWEAGLRYSLSSLAPFVWYLHPRRSEGTKILGSPAHISCQVPNAACEPCPLFPISCQVGPSLTSRSAASRSQQGRRGGAGHGSRWHPADLHMLRSKQGGSERSSLTDWQHLLHKHAASCGTLASHGAEPHLPSMYCDLQRRARQGRTSREPQHHPWSFCDIAAHFSAQLASR